MKNFLTFIKKRGCQMCLHSTLYDTQNNVERSESLLSGKSESKSSKESNSV